MHKIVILIGTRPNYIKALPVFEVLKEYYKVIIIHSGQHYQENMREKFYEDLEFKSDIQLKLENSTESSQLGEMIIKLTEEFKKIEPDLVLVFGDVTTTLAGAITTNKMHIKLAHIEAGLRCGDKNMSEECNRILTDHLSNYHFVTEVSAIENLQKENLKKNIYFVGNTMIDTLIMFYEKIIKRDFYKTLNLTKQKYILVTLHRQSNVENKDILKTIIEKLNILSKKYQIVFPIHHRTKRKINEFGLYFSENLIIIDPLGYIDFMNLVINSYLVITDGGGISEETSFLSIPCLTLRENTERPITLLNNAGSNKLIKIADLECQVQNIKHDFDCKIEKWDGNARFRILEVIKKLFN